MKMPKIHIPGVQLRNILMPTLLAVWMGLMAWGTIEVYLLLTQKQQAEIKKATRFYNHYMSNGRMLARVTRYDEAQAYFKQALKIAPDRQARCDASFDLAQAYLSGARHKLEPNALLASQYFEAVIETDSDPDRVLKAYRGLIEASALMKDLETVNHACHTALALATNPVDRADFLLHQMDVYMAIGRWADMQTLYPEIEPFMKDSKWQDPFHFKWAAMNEQVLSKKSWFDEYAAVHTNQAPEELRRALLKGTIAQFQKLAESSTPMIRDESLFRIARLLCNEEQFHEAESYIQVFLDNEPSIHLDETLLMLSRMARIEGETKTADELITTFLKRYRLNTQASQEFSAVVEELERKKMYLQALRLISQYINLPAAQDYLPKYISKAAELANRLGRYEEGTAYFKSLLKVNPDAKILSAALLDQATACIQRNDLAEADKWLTYYLNRFRHDPKRADALFKLFEIKVRSKAFATEVMLVGTAALEAGPSDPRAVEALIVMARSLEQIGLLSLAQAQYSKIGLLNMTAGSGQDKNVMINVGNAMLGNARCLYKMGSFVKADHLLRELVNNFDVEPVKSEAAYWWASMALDRRQTVEAERRLALANADQARPEIAAKIQFERNLLDIAAGTQVAETIDSLLKKLSDLPPDEYSDFVRRAYSVYFDKLYNERDVASMQKLLTAAANGPHVRELPLRAFFLQLAQIVLTDQGPQAFIQCLKDNEQILKSTGGQGLADQNYLLGTIQQIEQTRAAVESFIQGKKIGG
jgi:tetratricopeptide (TPR) repeat protein